MMTEAVFQRQVIELARLCGWLVYHTHDSRKSAAGFPDLVLVRGRRCVFAELKSDVGKPSADQVTWLTALQAAEEETYLWRPTDWPQIQATLTAA